MIPDLHARLSRLARNPPWGRRALAVLAVAAAALVFWGVEQVWGWPEALTPNHRAAWRIDPTPQP